jgi:hypothetical protein
MARAQGELIIAPMEVLLGYVLGLGTIALFAKEAKQTGKGGEGRTVARDAVAWAARHVGAMSAKVAHSVSETGRIARDEYTRGREQQLAHGSVDGLGHAPEKIVHHTSASRLNGN